MYCLFVLFYVLFVCRCVLLPPGVNPIAVKYIISYHVVFGYTWEDNIKTGGNTVLRFGLNTIVTRQRTEDWSFAYNTKPSDPAKEGGFLRYLNDYCVLRNDFDACI